MWNIFKNDNEWNEKAIVGFIAFIVMVLFALTDLFTGYLGKDLVINETIYNPAGKFSSTDIDHNDFSLLLGFDTGFQFWINSVCLNPSVYINKNADIGYAFELHNVIGFYDSISFRYAFGNNDYS